MAKGLLIHDVLGAAIGVGIFVAVLGGSFAVFCVQDWLKWRRIRKTRAK